MSKLSELLESEGMNDTMEFLEVYGLDCVVPGICKNKGCSYTTQYEPDQTQGWCEECGTPSVVSGLILIGVI